MKQDGGPAFPVPAGVLNDHTSGTSIPLMGMTLRDYFAAKAMTGLFSFWVAVNAKAVINDPDPQIISEMAYRYADAMLAERAK